MRPRSRARLAGIGAVAGLMVAAGGAASGYWAGAGGGSGAATTTLTTAVTVSPATPVADLYPGAQADVALELSNPNTAEVHVGSLTLDTARGTSGFAVDPGHLGCDLSSLDLPTQTNAGNGWTVPASTGGGDGTLAVTLTDSLSMAADAANACQGARFTAYLTAGS
jgi:hypothetical protein